MDLFMSISLSEKNSHRISSKENWHRFSAYLLELCMIGGSLVAAQLTSSLEKQFATQ
jgi:hypothetical protein